MNICAANCIQIKTDKAGNFIRLIDDSKCVHCGRCETVCPSNECPHLSMPQKAYIAWSKKPEKKSSSGGIAASIYRYCLAHQIACIGVKYDESFVAKYDFIDRMEEIDYFVGSKYVYSHMDSIYQKIIAQLEKGGKIVFVGLPCHIAALKNLANRKDANLICIDLVCHGIVAEKIFLGHIKYLQKNISKKDGNRKIESINFRENRNSYGITVRGESGKLLKRQPPWTEEYMLSYSKGFILCEQCYHCQYAQKKRASDLTIKDFCGKDRPPELRGRLRSISNILVNTDNGAALLEEMKPYLNLIDYSVDSVVAEDEMLRRPMPQGKRKWFLKLYPLLGFERSIHILCWKTMLKGRIEHKLGTPLHHIGIAAMGSMRNKYIGKWKKLSDKHLEMFLLMNEWMIIKQKGTSIQNYFEENGYQAVAVYGLSYIGERLIDELKECNIEIKYAVDRRSCCYSDIPVYAPEDKLPDADLLIVTAVSSYDEIYNSLADKVTYPIVSLEDILYELSF